MSDPRNSPPNSLRRAANSPRVVSTTALGCATVALLVACSDDGLTAPGGPSPSARAAFGRTAEDSVAEFRRDSVKFALEAAKDSAKAAAKAEKNLAKAQLDSLKADWEAYKRAVKRKDVKAEVLRCEPQKRESETRVIGPKGGTINIGPHRLVVPAGALASEVSITGTAPSNPAVNLQFAPHGLQFLKPVEMVIDYRQCIVPETTELGVTYMLNSVWGVEKMPSTDARKDKKIAALTDHFSGFTITWSSRDRAVSDY